MNKIKLEIPDLTEGISQLSESDYLANCADCGVQIELGHIAALAVKEGRKVLCGECCYLLCDLGSTAR
jgi:hypothetical protein